MTDGERDPADSDNWPLGKMISLAMQGRSENSIATLSASMGPDYKISRQTLRNYRFGHRESNDGPLIPNADLVRRIAAVLELDPREALRAAGLSDEAERHPPRTKVEAPLDTTEVLADKVATLPFAIRQSLQHIIDSLVAAHADTPTPKKQAVITSVPGGQAWRGHRSSAGSGTRQAAEEAHS